MKQFFSVTTLLLITQITWAQNTKVGVKGGVNFSNLKFKTEFGSGSSDGGVSIYVGLLADFEIDENLHVQSELLYSIEGSEESSVTYLNIPAMFKLRLNREFSFLVGPQVGFLLDAENGTEGLNIMNYALNIGAAYQLDSGFFFEARYSRGISNILLMDEFFEDDRVFTRNFQIGVGYFF